MDTNTLKRVLKILLTFLLPDQKIRDIPDLSAAVVTEIFRQHNESIAPGDAQKIASLVSRVRDLLITLTAGTIFLYSIEFVMYEASRIVADLPQTERIEVLNILQLLLKNLEKLFRKRIPMRRIEATGKEEQAGGSLIDISDEDTRYTDEYFLISEIPVSTPYSEAILDAFRKIFQTRYGSDALGHITKNLEKALFSFLLQLLDKTEDEFTMTSVREGMSSQKIFLRAIRGLEDEARRMYHVAFIRYVYTIASRYLVGCRQTTRDSKNVVEGMTSLSLGLPSHVWLVQMYIPWESDALLTAQKRSILKDQVGILESIFAEDNILSARYRYDYFTFFIQDITETGINYNVLFYYIEKGAPQPISPRMPDYFNPLAINRKITRIILHELGKRHLARNPIATQQDLSMLTNLLEIDAPSSGRLDQKKTKKNKKHRSRRPSPAPVPPAVSSREQQKRQTEQRDLLSQSLKNYSVNEKRRFHSFFYFDQNDQAALGLLPTEDAFVAYFDGILAKEIAEKILALNRDERLLLDRFVQDHQGSIPRLLRRMAERRTMVVTQQQQKKTLVAPPQARQDPTSLQTRRSDVFMTWVRTYEDYARINQELLAGRSVQQAMRDFPYLRLFSIKNARELQEKLFSLRLSLIRRIVSDFVMKPFPLNTPLAKPDSLNDDMYFCYNPDALLPYLAHTEYSEAIGEMPILDSEMRKYLYKASHIFYAFGNLNAMRFILFWSMLHVENIPLQSIPEYFRILCLSMDPIPVIPSYPRSKIVFVCLMDYIFHLRPVLQKAFLRCAVTKDNFEPLRHDLVRYGFMSRKDADGSLGDVWEEMERQGNELQEIFSSMKQHVSGLVNPVIRSATDVP